VFVNYRLFVSKPVELILSLDDLDTARAYPGRIRFVRFAAVRALASGRNAASVGVMRRSIAWLVLVVTACSGEVVGGALHSSEPAAPRSPADEGAAGSAGDDAPPPIDMTPIDAPQPQQPEPPAAPSDFDAPARCTSESFYVNTEADDDDDRDEYEVEGDPRMHPGRACITCHRTYDGPSFAIGGTVYPTAHEPDDCESPSTAGAQVIITDAAGRELVLEVNEAGNFRSRESDAIVMPIRAKVVFEGRERVMFGERMTGDCNSCHTQNGENGAPGRILAP
jgi:mono/diheme cytochrome c family protein